MDQCLSKKPLYFIVFQNTLKDILVETILSPSRFVVVVVLFSHTHVIMTTSYTFGFLKLILAAFSS